MELHCVLENDCVNANRSIGFVGFALGFALLRARTAAAACVVTPLLQLGLAELQSEPA